MEPKDFIKYRAHLIFVVTTVGLFQLPSLFNLYFIHNDGLILSVSNHPELAHLKSIGRHFDAWLLQNFYYRNTETIEGLTNLRIRNLMILVLGALLFVRTSCEILNDRFAGTLIGISAAMVPSLGLAVLQISHTHHILGFLVSTLSFATITSMALGTGHLILRSSVTTIVGLVAGVLGVILYYTTITWIFYLPILIAAGGIALQRRRGLLRDFVQIYLLAASSAAIAFVVALVFFVKVGAQTFPEYQGSLHVSTYSSKLNLSSILRIVAESVTSMAAINHYPWLTLFVFLPALTVVGLIRARVWASSKFHLPRIGALVTAIFVGFSVVVTALINFNSNDVIASRFLHLSNTSMAIACLATLKNSRSIQRLIKFQHINRISQFSFLLLLLISGLLLQSNSAKLSRELYHSEALRLFSENYPNGNSFLDEAHGFTYYESTLPLVYNTFPISDNLQSMVRDESLRTSLKPNSLTCLSSDMALRDATTYYGQFLTGYWQIQLDTNLDLYNRGAQSLTTSCSNLWNIIRRAEERSP